eukprot:scaffold9219_cov121-Cylindrotheca_fusiformis.AAC.2
METIPKVRGHRCRMPAKFKGNLIILGAPILETNCSSHPIRVGNNLLNMLPHVMQRIGIGTDTCSTHDRGNLLITKETIGNLR